MIITNESKFASLAEDADRTLANSFIYILSPSIRIGGDDEEILAGTNKPEALIPPQQLVQQLTSGEISKKRFRKEYLDHLKSKEAQFTIYTIVRSINEKKYLPVFVVSDEDWELGYLKIFAKYLEKRFGLKSLKVKDYLKAVKAAWKASKKVSKKGKKRRKAFRAEMKDFTKDNVSISFEGLDRLEKLDRKYAIDRIAILLGHSEDAMEEVSKKAIIRAIQSYSDWNKKASKRVKRAIKSTNVSKKTDRWSKRDAIEIVMTVYNEIHANDGEAASTRK